MYSILMSVVHNVNKTKVIKKSDKLYSIECETELNKILLYKNLISSEKIKESDKAISLMVDNVESLEQYLKKNDNKLEYHMVLKLAKDLVLVKENLNKYNLMFVNLDINDIIVINEDIFMFINYNNIYNLLDDDSISIENILTRSEFNKKKEFIQESVPY